MLNFLKKSLSIEIDGFISYIKQNLKGKEIASFTKSAFVQCRKKIKPDIFKHMSDVLIQEFYTDNDASIKLWRGFRLLAVDSSLITLPGIQALAEVYGRAKNKCDKLVVQGRVSVLYDVLNRFVIDGSLSHVSTGERILATHHLPYAKQGDLIIYDRGYPSFDLIYEHYERGLDFLMRTKIDFNNAVKEFYNSGSKSCIIKIYPSFHKRLSDKPYNKYTFKEIRLVRVELPGDQDEVIMTSLLDAKAYPDSIFKDLYFSRWKVETFYDELKNKMKLEHFSGYSPQSIMQDFYAMIFVSNAQSLIVGDINDELAQQSTKRKHQYKVNNNISYGFLKDRIITMFFSSQPIDDTVAELKELFMKNIVPIRPNRKYERDTKRYQRQNVHKVLKNSRDAI